MTTVNTKGGTPATPDTPIKDLEPGIQIGSAADTLITGTPEAGTIFVVTSDRKVMQMPDGILTAWWRKPWVQGCILVATAGLAGGAGYYAGRKNGQDELNDCYASGSADGYSRAMTGIADAASTPAP